MSLHADDKLVDPKTIGCFAATAVRGILLYFHGNPDFGDMHLQGIDTDSSNTGILSRRWFRLFTTVCRGPCEWSGKVAEADYPIVKSSPG
jgi:hypothetical protein